MFQVKKHDNTPEKKSKALECLQILLAVNLK